MREPKFNIGERVYHNTPDSDAGVITNIIYYHLTKALSYEIAVGWDNVVYCREFELSREKVF